jgi:aminopeptidase N
VRTEQEHLGPVGVGYRASSFKIPSGYLIQAYHKGPMVLHMLRVMLRNETGSDELFRRLLSSFLQEHAGGEASTADFRRQLEMLTGRDWSWFFRQWVEGTHIPEYRWQHQVQDGRLEVTVNQVEAPEGFRMPVPLLVEYEDGTREQLVLDIDLPQETFSFELTGTPREVTFNPDNAVLARVGQNRI